MSIAILDTFQVKMCTTEELIEKRRTGMFTKKLGVFMVSRITWKHSLLTWSNRKCPKSGRRWGFPTSVYTNSSSYINMSKWRVRPQLVQLRPTWQHNVQAPWSVARFTFFSLFCQFGRTDLGGCKYLNWYVSLKCWLVLVNMEQNWWQKIVRLIKCSQNTTLP